MLVKIPLKVLMLPFEKWVIWVTIFPFFWTDEWNDFGYGCFIEFLVGSGL